VLLSGGLDSATAAAVAGAQGFELHALTVDYGQRHACELEAARRVAAHLHIQDHVVQRLDLRVFGGSALTAAVDVPKDRTDEELATGIPATYVPARNTILLALALAFAEVRSADDVFIGVNAVDYSGYPDCRPEFIRKFEELSQLATRAGAEGRRLSVHAPLADLSKAEIIRTGLRLGVDFRMTISCYDPSAGGLACGRCDSCLLRARGFAQAGVADPTRYAGGTPTSAGQSC
jgi:7-cyano-7-deazaguanine synthase